MGLRNVFTDHSLFGFADTASINLNKTMKWPCSQLDAAICVSQAGRDNLALRVAVAPEKIFVIPNAVDADQFRPDPSL